MVDFVADTVIIDNIRKNKPTWSDSYSLYFVLCFCVMPLITMIAELIDNKQIKNILPNNVDTSNSSATGVPISNDGEDTHCFPKFVPGIEEDKQNNTVNLLNDLIINGKRFGTNPGIVEFSYIALLVRSGIILNPSFEDLCKTYQAYTSKSEKNHQVYLGNNRTGLLYSSLLDGLHWDKMNMAADYFASVIPKDFMLTINKKPKKGE